MPSFGQTVLVTGATGKQGGTLARVLLKRGHRVRAVARKADALAAKELKKLGAEIAVATFDDRTALQRAAQGVDAVFAMSTPFEAGPDAEVRQGCGLADAMKVAGVGHLVYASVAGAHELTGIPHFDSKHRIEQHIKSIGIPTTVVAPVFFMENFLNPPWLQGLQENKLAMALPGSRRLQHIALEDIANFIAVVLEKKRAFIGKRIEIASDEATGEQAAAVLSKVTGRQIQYAEVPIDQIRSTSDDAAKMFEWFKDAGFKVDIASLRRDYAAVGWHSFEAWAEQQNWSKLKEAALH